MSGHLFDDLDRIFNLCEDVDTSLDRGIGSLAEYFTSEAVDLLECIGGKRVRTGSSFLLSSCCFGSFLLSSDGCISVKFDT